MSPYALHLMRLRRISLEYSFGSTPRSRAKSAARHRAGLLPRAANAARVFLSGGVVGSMAVAIEGGIYVGLGSVRAETEVDGMFAERRRSAVAVSRGRRWFLRGGAIETPVV